MEDLAIPAAPWDRSRLRLGLILWTFGAIGCASLLLAPLELIQPPQIDLGPLAFRALSLVNPMILLTLMVALGTWLAPRAGLDAPLFRAWLQRDPMMPIAQRQIGSALLVGIVAAMILLLFGRLTEAWFAGTVAARFDMPLLPKLLYGGITEEILSRWGLMTLFVWLLLKMRVSGAPAYVGGAIIAAFLFAAGHLPMLAILVGMPTAPMVAAVLAGNFVPGFLFGLLFWKRGLESAMMAHALAHLAAWILLQTI